MFSTILKIIGLVQIIFFIQDAIEDEKQNDEKNEINKADPD